MSTTDPGKIRTGETPSRIRSFAPLLGREPLILILGSMPGVRSLEAGQYYGHERNYFWKLICAVLEEPEREDYEERVAMLKRRRIALWDSVQSCVRPGSLDKDIREETPNDIAGLLAANPTIRAVGFNGQAAQKMYRKYNRDAFEKKSPEKKSPEKKSVEYLLLPSSSPIPRRMVKSFEDRLAQWLELRRFLDQC